MNRLSKTREIEVELDRNWRLLGGIERAAGEKVTPAYSVDGITHSSRGLVGGASGVWSLPQPTPPNRNRSFFTPHSARARDDDIGSCIGFENRRLSCFTRDFRNILCWPLVARRWL